MKEATVEGFNTATQECMGAVLQEAVCVFSNTAKEENFKWL